MRSCVRAIFCCSACASREPGSTAFPRGQVVGQRQVVEVAAAFAERERFDRLARERQRAVRAAQAVEGGDDLVSQEAVRFRERRGQHVHRLLRRDLRERRGDVAADPDVLFRVAHEVGERVDHGLAVARPAPGGRAPSAGGSGAARSSVGTKTKSDAPAACTLSIASSRHLGRGVVEQRDQQRPEARVRDVTDGGGHVAAAGAAGSRESPASSTSAASAASTSAGDALAASATAAVTRMRGSGSASSGRDSVVASSLLMAPIATIAAARTPESGVAQHAPDLREPSHADVAAHGAQRAQRALPDLRRLVIEQQRRDEVALVERLEHVDGVDHAGRVRLRQLLHERLDGRQIAAAQPDFGGHDVAALDALAERREVALARAQRHEDPRRPSPTRLA